MTMAVEVVLLLFGYGLEIALLPVVNKVPNVITKWKYTSQM